MDSKKLLKRILTNTNNIKFQDFISLVSGFGFELDRINGSHHIYKKAGVEELINLQNVKGEIKPYQVKQFLTIIEKYNLQIGEEK
ncbi:MAG: hypothetical protein HW421_2608 [Ignavibacteria bacterium]|nr:hypothetical protein [Ignavibacteria bacterium]